MKNLKYGLIALMLLLMVLLACSMQSEENTGKVQAVIEAQSQKFSAAYNRQDAKAIADLYTENGRVLPPFSKMVRGRAAIIKSNEAEFAMGFSNLQLSTVSVDVQGDIAHEIGKYTINLPPRGDEVMKDHGKYLAVWKKQSDGSWLMDIDIWNSSMPPPGM
ncbi:MAG: hypothetical protein Kow0042_15890 [Calditrichia bacterium]